MEDYLALYYKEPVMTEEERARRDGIDHLIAKVHESHQWFTATPNQTSVNRQRMLRQYIRLPEEPSYRSDRLGEILVNFYSFDLGLLSNRKETLTYSHKETEDYSDDEPDTPLPRAERSDSVDSDDEPDTPFPQNERSTYVDIPLQYLYDIPRGGVPEMNLSYMPLRIGSKTNTAGNLRVVEFPTNYYAADFLKAMRPEISLDELINNSKTAMIKHSKRTKFLTGVSQHPQTFYPVNSSNPKLPNMSSKFDTLLFIAIPYLGHEPLSNAYFRGYPPANTSYNGSQEMVDPEIERLTAYHQVNNLRTDLSSEPLWNPTLSLFEYRFPSQGDTMVFDERRTVLNLGGSEEAAVVHQAWFMVFDNETIAAFRSPNDTQPEHTPLFPNYRMTHGAYHGLLNMLASILPSSEFKILNGLRERVSELEFAIQSSHYGNDGLTLKLNTVKVELTTITHVVENQIQILATVKKFFINEHKEQFRIMYEYTDELINERKDFCTQVGAIVRDVEAAQQLVFQIQSTNQTPQRNDTTQVPAWQPQNVPKRRSTNKEMMMNENMKEAGSQNSRPLFMPEQTQSQAESLVKFPEETEKQPDSTLLVIAMVLAIYLPLSFFTSYYGNIRCNNFPARESSQSSSRNEHNHNNNDRARFLEDLRAGFSLHYTNYTCTMFS